MSNGSKPQSSKTPKATDFSEFSMMVQRYANLIVKYTNDSGGSSIAAKKMVKALLDGDFDLLTALYGDQNNFDPKAKATQDIAFKLCSSVYKLGKSLNSCKQRLRPHNNKLSSEVQDSQAIDQSLKDSITAVYKALLCFGTPYNLDSEDKNFLCNAGAKISSKTIEFDAETSDPYEYLKSIKDGPAKYTRLIHNHFSLGEEARSLFHVLRFAPFACCIVPVSLGWFCVLHDSLSLLQQLGFYFCPILTHGDRVKMAEVIEKMQMSCQRYPALAHYEEVISTSLKRISTLCGIYLNDLRKELVIRDPRCVVEIIGLGAARCPSELKMMREFTEVGARQYDELIKALCAEKDTKLGAFAMSEIILGISLRSGYTNPEYLKKLSSEEQKDFIAQARGINLFTPYDYRLAHKRTIVACRPQLAEALSEEQRKELGVGSCYAPSKKAYSIECFQALCEVLNHNPVLVKSETMPDSQPVPAKKLEAKAEDADFPLGFLKEIVDGLAAVNSITDYCDALQNHGIDPDFCRLIEDQYAAIQPKFEKLLHSNGLPLIFYTTSTNFLAQNCPDVQRNAVANFLQFYAFVRFYSQAQNCQHLLLVSESTKQLLAKIFSKEQQQKLRVNIVAIPDAEDYSPAAICKDKKNLRLHRKVQDTICKMASRLCVVQRNKKSSAKNTLALKPNERLVIWAPALTDEILREVKFTHPSNPEILERDALTEINYVIHLISGSLRSGLNVNDDILSKTLAFSYIDFRSGHCSFNDEDIPDNFAANFVKESDFLLFDDDSCAKVLLTIIKSKK